MPSDDVTSADSESKRGLDTLIENLPGVVYRCLNTPDWPMEFISDAVLNLTGRPAAEFLHSRVSWGSIIHPADRANVWNQVQEAVARRKPYRTEYRLTTAEGKEKWVWEQGRGVFGEDGELEALEGFIIDVTKRRLAEEALSASEERYRNLVESAPDCIHEIDADGRFLRVNRAGLRILGAADNAEVEGRSCLEFVAEEDRARVAALMARAFAGETCTFECRTSSAARGRLLSSAFSPLRSPDGSISRIVSISTDITTQKLAEMALRKTETRNRAILDALPDLVFRLDLDGTFLDCRTPSSTLLGAPADEMIGKSLEDVLPAETAVSALEKMRQAQDTGRTQRFEFQLTPHGDQSMTFEAYISPSAADEVLVVSRDVTEQRRVQASRARLAAIVDSTEDAIIGKSLDGIIRSWNAGAERLYGYSADEIVGDSITVLTPKGLAGEAAEILETIKRGETARLPRTQRRRKDGSLVDVSLTVSPMRSEDGRLVGASTIARDITALVEAHKALEQREAELRESQARLQRLAGRLISAEEEASRRIARELHDDFGQRIAGLMMQSSVLERRLVDNAVAYKGAVHLTKKLGELAGDVQKLSRRLHSSVLEKVGLESALKSECSSFAAQTGVEVRCSSEGTIDGCSAEASLALYRVAQEALRNVAKHSGATRVEMALVGKPSGAALRVCDNGTGFDWASSRFSPGLGLTSMEERMRPLGGSVSVSSKVGEGTTVEVFVPHEAPR